MEYSQNINRVELQGIVGTSKVTNIGDKKAVRFSLATNYVYKDKEGYPVIETTWHACSVWAEREDDLMMYRKGTPLHIEGRIHRCERLRENHTGGGGVKGREGGTIIMEKVKLGATIRVIRMNDDGGKDLQARMYNGRSGVVEYIDSLGQLHGTWGGLAVIPGVDDFEIVETL